MIGFIYKIYCKNEPDDICYIGSTIQNINNRFSNHKSDFKKNRRFCQSKKIFEKYGIENCIIELIEKIECENKNILKNFEKKYIELFEKSVNKNIPNPTPNDRKEQKKKYRENNKEKIKLHNSKKYYCELCKKSILNHNKKRHENTLIHKKYL
jgi:hypothetical protein